MNNNERKKARKVVFLILAIIMITGAIERATDHEDMSARALPKVFGQSTSANIITTFADAQAAERGNK